MRHIKRLIILIVICLLGACGTPIVVKELSAEQLNILKSSRESLATNFTLINQVLTNQILANKIAEDEALDKEIAIYRKRYEKRITEEGDHEEKFLIELTNQVKDLTDKSRAEKEKYDQILLKLNDKHKALLDVIDHLIEGQTTLNTYVQLEKADEAAVNTLFPKIGADKEKLRKSIDDVNGFISDLTPIKEQTK